VEFKKFVVFLAGFAETMKLARSPEKTIADIAPCVVRSGLAIAGLGDERSFHVHNLHDFNPCHFMRHSMVKATDMPAGWSIQAASLD
jgi:hypothetical protein